MTSEYTDEKNIEKLVESEESAEVRFVGPEETLTGSDELVGRQIGGCEILSSIGTGGMSTVYKARHIMLNRLVAVKIMLSQFIYDRKTILRFQQEAKAATNLQHPNILSVKEFGVDDKAGAYIIMEYVDGPTLAGIIEDKGTLRLKYAVELIRQVCRGLSHAHSEGVVHRDLKPSNIMIVKNQEGKEITKLLDFGIAKLSRDDSTELNLTKTGEIFGTPKYMSPEQCNGQEIDKRSDIYSIGCILFEMLTGRPPFAGDSSMSILMSHINEEPEPLAKIDKSISKDMETVVSRCLEKDPKHRYQSADELLVDLERILDDEPILSRARFRFKKGKDLTFRQKIGMATIFAVILGIVLAAGPAILDLVGMNPFSDAKSFDSRSYIYFVRGEYRKAAALLEFGVQAYKDKVEEDKKRGDRRAQWRDEALLAENLQHIGQCYLMIGKRLDKEGKAAKAEAELRKALSYMRRAEKIWRKYPNGMQEFVDIYAQILSRLGMVNELEKLREFARERKLNMPDLKPTAPRVRPATR